MTASPSPVLTHGKGGAAAPTQVRYGVLGFCCLLAMITYLDRVCFGTVAPYIQKEFSLSDSQLGLLFTAFALAYSIFEVPTGWLGDFFGARRTLIRIVLWWSAFTALTGLIYPTFAGAFILLLSVRFLFGVGEAGAFPNISRAFASWFPRTERGFAQGSVWMAGRFAGGVSPLLVLMLAYTTIDSSGVAVTYWRHIFWIFGGIGVIWCVAFWFWFRDEPPEHKSVNEAEWRLIRGFDQNPFGQVPDNPNWRERFASRSSAPTSSDIQNRDDGIESRQDGIQQGTPQQVAPPTEPNLEQDSHAGVPWGKLLTNANLWILCLMYFCCAYGWYFNITWLPKYLGQRYGVTREDYGIWAFSLLAGAPLLFGSLACLAGGLLTDSFIRQTGNRKWGRRLYGMIGHGLCAGCYFLSLMADSPWVFVFFVALAAFCNDLTMGSAWASCIDIGGKYAGIVSGCMNTIGNLGGAVAGYATGFALDLYKDTATPQMGWTVNFFSYGVVYLIAVFLWLCFDATKQVAQ